MLDFLAVPMTGLVASSFGADLTNTENLFTPRLGRAMRFASGGIKTVIVDLLVARPLDVVALVAHDLDEDSTWRFWTGDVANLAPTGGVAGGAPVGATTHDSGVLAMLASPEGDARVHRVALDKMDAPVTSRYLRFDIDADTAGAVGRLVVGEAFEPLEGRDYGWDTRVVDLGSVQRTKTSLEDISIRAKVAEFTWTWSGLDKDEAENAAFELMAKVGTTRDVLLCLDYTAANRHNLIGFGKLTEPSVKTNYAEGWNELRCQQLSNLVLAL